MSYGKCVGLECWSEYEQHVINVAEMLGKHCQPTRISLTSSPTSRTHKKSIAYVCRYTHTHILFISRVTVMLCLTSRKYHSRSHHNKYLAINHAIACYSHPRTRACFFRHRFFLCVCVRSDLLALVWPYHSVIRNSLAQKTNVFSPFRERGNRPRKNFREQKISID